MNAEELLGAPLFGNNSNKKECLFKTKGLYYFFFHLHTANEFLVLLIQNYFYF